MSKADLINIYLAFFAIIITLLSVKWATYSSPQKRSRIRKKVNFLLILILVSVIGITGYYIFVNNLKAEKEIEWIDFQQSDEYKEIMSEIENRDYSVARKKIVKKMEEFKINNEYGYIELAIIRASCYFYEAVIQNNEKDIKDLCLDNCVYTIQDLLNNYDVTRNQKNRAKTCLGLAYIYFNDELYFDDLKEIAVDLEEQLINSSDLMIDDLMFFLGMYYEEKIRRDNLKEDISNILYYYEKAIEYNKNTENLNVLNDDVNDLFKLKIANFCYEFVTTGDTDEEYLKKIISIYDGVIPVLNWEQDIYFKSLDKQGECYMLLYINHRNTHGRYDYGVCDECTNYSDKAYNNFKAILYTSRDNVPYFLMEQNFFLELNPSLGDVLMLLNRYIKMQKVPEEMKNTYYELVECFEVLRYTLKDDNYLYQRMENTLLFSQIDEGYLTQEQVKDLKDLYYRVIDEILRLLRYSN